MSKHVVLSLSGGMDSSTLLLRCLKEYDSVTAISFDYGQKHRVELERAQDLVNYINLSRLTESNINYQVIKLDGLIYWHYWFGNNITTLEKVPQEHLINKKIKQNFCFAWANGDWTKSWQGDDKTTIFKQVYSKESAIKHFRYIKPFFEDKRYIKVNEDVLFQVNNVICNEVLNHMRILDELTKKKLGIRIHFVVPRHNLKFSLENFIYSFSSYPPGEIYSPLFSFRHRGFHHHSLRFHQYPI